MTLKELRIKRGLSQFEAAVIASKKVKMNSAKWSILEGLDNEFIKGLEEAFGEKIDMPTGGDDD